MPHVVIIGGGIAGLATAYRLRQDAEAAGRPLRLSLVEREPRFGGKVVTNREDGFLIEGGPDSIIPRKPWALELIRELGLEGELLPSNDAKRGTYVLHDGRLERLPDGIQLGAPGYWVRFLRSPLLSLPAKLRIAAEVLVPRRRGDGDESVADFVRRRLGEGALWTLAEPLLAHIHVGDVERMSLCATYPMFADLEARYGSLTRAIATLRAGRSGAPAAAAPSFWTLKGGLSTLIDALVERLDPGSRHAGRAVAQIRRGGEGPAWTVQLDDGRELAADAVVLATPAAAAAALLSEVEPDVAARLAAIRYAPMATLSLGYRRADVGHPLDGFGFFVPRRERRRVLACTWSSTKFDHRAGPDDALLRIFLGGVGSEELLALADDALAKAVRDDLAELMGLTAAPRIARLYRWPYPQYDVGHLDRVAELESALPPGLFLTGSAYRGVGLPDCVKNGAEAGRQVLEHLPLG